LRGRHISVRSISDHPMMMMDLSYHRRPLMKPFSGNILLTPMSFLFWAWLTLSHPACVSSHRGCQMGTYSVFLRIMRTLIKSSWLASFYRYYGMEMKLITIACSYRSAHRDYFTSTTTTQAWCMATLKV